MFKREYNRGRDVAYCAHQDCLGYCKDVMCYTGSMLSSRVLSSPAVRLHCLARSLARYRSGRHVIR
jgi:hypothetical protein